jgi:ectoine hydroxylase
MQLTAQQLEQFREEGWLFLPGCFAEAEVALLRDEAESIYATDRQEVWREKTGAPRTAFAAHTYNEAFRLLGSHPRLIRPVEQVFGEQLYMHQVQDQREGRVRGRCLAMAPGLRHLGAR